MKRPSLSVLRVVLALGAGCSSRACAKSREVPVYNVVPMPGLAFSRAEAPSTECPHASSARSGRVAVLSRPYTGVIRVGPVDDGPLARSVPRFIDLPRGGARLLLERPQAHNGGYEVRTTSGVLVFSGGGSSRGCHGVAREDHYYVEGVAHSWTGAEGLIFDVGMNQGAELLACAIGEMAAKTTLQILIASPGGMQNHGPSERDYTRVAAMRVKPGSALQAAWGFTADEPGVGAIDAAGHTVVVLSSGRFVVLRPEGDEGGLAILATDSKVEPGATDLSIIPPFVVVLYGGGDAGELARRRDEATTTSRVEARNPDGALAWRATVPFVARQPPIDGGDRIYVVGAGIAALDLDGRTLWSSPSTVQIRAAAFADGTLAIVRGAELQIVAKDGTIQQHFNAEELLTTLPAIASDGAVWVASPVVLSQISRQVE